MSRVVGIVAFHGVPMEAALAEAVGFQRGASAAEATGRQKSALCGRAGATNLGDAKAASD
jgi:hypothetical protein